MILYFGLLAVGLALVIIGADYFVSGASLIARRLRVSNLIIGLTIVAMGTSFPELGINITSVLKGHNDLAMGNILGSNIANILLVFSAGGLLQRRMIFARGTSAQTGFMVTVSLLLLLAGYFGPGRDDALTRWEGIGMLIIIFTYWAHMVRVARRLSNVAGGAVEEVKGKIPGSLPTWKVCLIVIVSLGVLLLGAQLATKSAVLIARTMGIPEIVIAATVIAVGTSLPEVVTSIQAARQGCHDVILGNIVGSNIFNTLFILGSCAVIADLPVESEAISYMRINFLTSILLLIGLTFPGQQIFERWKAVLFLGLYFIFLLYVAGMIRL